MTPKRQSEDNSEYQVDINCQFERIARGDTR